MQHIRLPTPARCFISSPDSVPHEPQPHLRRLPQIQGLTLAGLAAIALVAASRGRWDHVALELGAGLVLLAAILLGRSGRSETAASLTFGTLAVVAAAFLWIGQGPRDPAVLAFPGVLVFAAILGNRRRFLLVLGFFLAALALSVAGNLAGWHVSPTVPVTVATYLDLAVILLVIGFVVWVLAEDLRQALAGLNTEHAQVVQSQTRIEFLSRNDPLTGLPNRTLGRDRLEQAIALAARNRAGAALIHLDLDDFKAINDSLGHADGDELLRAVAGRLTGILRGADSVSRQGEDEFHLVLGGISQSDEAAAIADKVLETLAAPFQIRGLEVAVTVSMGIAMVPTDGADFDTLMRKASLALNRAKEVGGNNFRFFLAGMNATAREYLQWVAELRLALVQGAFVLHYQPQFELAGGRVVGAEALIRWRHPERGMVPPGDFIPVAERSGLIGEIGAWVLLEACRQASAWRARGLDLIMAVNLSPAQFRRKDLEASLERALAESGLPSAALELELTESMLILDAEAVRARLSSLRGLGLSFAIDDFGTGYSNLGYLKKFEVERLKIDQSFVKRLTEDPQDEAIVRAIIQMAHALNLEVVAEGVETQAVLDRLRTLGCDTGQGYLWAKAMPGDAFLAFVEATREAELRTAR